MVAPAPKRASFFTSLIRSFSSSTSITKRLPTLRCINSIRTVYKSRVIEEAQKALREYLHSGRSLPFVFAELIAKNSPFSLSKLIRRVHFSVPKFSNTFTKLLMYEPINEFEFFLESIGIDHDNVIALLPPGKFFFSEDRAVLDAASALSQFGFPWNRLGTLYVDEVSIFSKCSDALMDRLCLLRERYGFDNNLCVVGICLAFPRLLSLEDKFGCDEDAIIDDLKRVYRELDRASCVEGNVEAWYELCCKVKIFYDLDCEKGTVGELMCLRKGVIFSCPNAVMAQKVDYLCGFGGRKVDVGLCLLQSPEILNLDLETPSVSVLGLLEHFGLDANELHCTRKKYPHVFGRNKLVNLPNIMKALDLHQWCFDKIKGSNGQLLATYALSCCDEGLDREFMYSLRQVESLRMARHTISKVEFLKEIGFGENSLTVSVLRHLHGTRSELQERFDFFIRFGIKHSKLCLMMITSTKILAQRPEKLEQKLNFLCGEMGLSLEYVSDFPNFLYFDLENRIKRRYRCYVWLQMNSLCAKDYAFTSLMASSEKKFVTILSNIHPAAPKHYFECF